MSTEPANPTTEQQPHRQLDTDWYLRFVTAGSFAAYEYLDGDKAYREGQRQQFEAGNIENPSLDYPKVDTAVLDTREAELLQLKQDMPSSETNETVRQTYRWKINEKVAELRMLKTTREMEVLRQQRERLKSVTGVFEGKMQDQAVGQVETLSEEKAKKEALPDIPNLFMVSLLLKYKDIPSIVSANKQPRNYNPKMKNSGLLHTGYC